MLQASQKGVSKANVRVPFRLILRTAESLASLGGAGPREAASGSGLGVVGYLLVGEGEHVGLLTCVPLAIPGNCASDGLFEIPAGEPTEQSAGFFDGKREEGCLMDIS